MNSLHVNSSQKETIINNCQFLNRTQLLIRTCSLHLFKPKFKWDLYHKFYPYTDDDCTPTSLVTVGKNISTILQSVGLPIIFFKLNFAK